MNLWRIMSIINVDEKSLLKPDIKLFRNVPCVFLEIRKLETLTLL